MVLCRSDHCPRVVSLFHCVFLVFVAPEDGSLCGSPESFEALSGAVPMGREPGVTRLNRLKCRPLKALKRGTKAVLKVLGTRNVYHHRHSICTGQSGYCLFFVEWEKNTRLERGSGLRGGRQMVINSKPGNVKHHHIPVESSI